MSPQHCFSSVNSAAIIGGRVEVLGFSRHLLQKARAAGRCGMIMAHLHQ